MSDSALDSRAESGDEGNGEDGDLVSEADMFGDEDDEGFDFEQNGNDDEARRSATAKPRATVMAERARWPRASTTTGDDDDEEDEFI